MLGQMLLFEARRSCSNEGNQCFSLCNCCVACDKVAFIHIDSIHDPILLDRFATMPSTSLRSTAVPLLFAFAVMMCVYDDRP